VFHELFLRVLLYGVTAVACVIAVTSVIAVACVTACVNGDDGLLLAWATAADVALPLTWAIVVADVALTWAIVVTVALLLAGVTAAACVTAVVAVALLLA
jgi:hypothetical protein